MGTVVVPVVTGRRGVGTCDGPEQIAEQRDRLKARLCNRINKI